MGTNQPHFVFGEVFERGAAFQIERADIALFLDFVLFVFEEDAKRQAL